jgi:AAA domain
VGTAAGRAGVRDRGRQPAGHGHVLLAPGRHRKHLREELVPRFQATYGRPPTQAELASLRQDANLATREHKPEAAIDWDQTHAGWRAKLAEACGVDLASVARVITREHAGTPRGEITQADITRAAQKALEKTAAEKASWTRADLLSHVGRMLPRTGADPAQRAELAEQITDRALAGEFAPVACLEAPALLSLPPDLIRSDGQSVYTRHGSARYATRASLDAEEQLVRLAGERGAPVAERELVAAKLGASVEDLEVALAGRAADTGLMLPCGLRLDQAAALYHGLTSDQRMIVINAATGSGKTTTATVAARIWGSLGGEVVGVTRASPAATPWRLASREASTSRSSSAMRRISGASSARWRSAPARWWWPTKAGCSAPPTCWTPRSWPAPGTARC